MEVIEGEQADFQCQMLKKLDQLIAATLNNKLTPKMSFDSVLWNTAQVAEYIGVSYKYTSEYIVTHHTFPGAMRVPNKDGKSGHPRWFAKDIVSWVSQTKQT